MGGCWAHGVSAEENIHAAYCYAAPAARDTCSGLSAHMLRHSDLAKTEHACRGQADTPIRLSKANGVITVERVFDFAIPELGISDATTLWQNAPQGIGALSICRCNIL